MVEGTDVLAFALMQAMRDIVAKCLVKDPTKRPTASQLLDHKFFKVGCTDALPRGSLLLHHEHRETAQAP